MISGKKVQIYGWISQPRFTISKIHPLRDEALSANCITPLRILKTITIGLKMVSGNAIKNC